jgi:hypothetical protein
MCGGSNKSANGRQGKRSKPKRVNANTQRRTTGAAQLQMPRLCFNVMAVNVDVFILKRTAVQMSDKAERWHGRRSANA